MAVAGILANPDECINQTIYISSTELTMNELLTIEQKVSNTRPEDWTVKHVKTDEKIADAQTTVKESSDYMTKMMATGRLGFAVNMKPEFGADYNARGLLQNDKFGVPREDLEEIVGKIRSQQQ